MATPMFIVTGFLDSGKTTMIKDTLMEQEWIEPGLTLLLLCEEGEEEYPEEYLKEKNMAVLKVEEFDQLNTVFFKNCERNYHPAQIIIEYNGMWKLEDLLSIRYEKFRTSGSILYRKWYNTGYVSDEYEKYADGTAHRV